MVELVFTNVPLKHEANRVKRETPTRYWMRRALKGALQVSQLKLDRT